METLLSLAGSWEPWGSEPSAWTPDTSIWAQCYPMVCAIPGQDTYNAGSLTFCRAFDSSWYNMHWKPAPCSRQVKGIYIPLGSFVSFVQHAACLGQETRESSGWICVLQLQRGPGYWPWVTAVRPEGTSKMGGVGHYLPTSSERLEPPCTEITPTAVC